MKAVLVFCEGRHDVVFAQRSLGVHAGCEWFGRRIGELPTPFGRNEIARKGFITRHLERHGYEDRPVRATAQPTSPVFESIVENAEARTMFFMIRIQGKTQSEPVVEMLRTLDDTFNLPPVGTFEFSKYAVAFLFDANSEGVMDTLEGFRKRYEQLFGDLSELGHGRWINSDTVPVGCFVFHKSLQKPTGTLDHHLAEMVKGVWPSRFIKAERFICDNANQGDQVSSSESDRQKAVITVAGQFNHPGDPMSIIIGRDGIPQAAFEKSQASKELSAFLTNVSWE